MPVSRGVFGGKVWLELAVVVAKLLAWRCAKYAISAYLRFRELARLKQEAPVDGDG